jgi:hypothetical protein
VPDERDRVIAELKAALAAAQRAEEFQKMRAEQLELALKRAYAFAAWRGRERTR